MPATDEDEAHATQANQPAIAPSVTVVLGQGDVVVSVQGDETTDFNTAVNAAHVEAQHFAGNSVFFDEGDQVHQHIHRD